MEAGCLLGGGDGNVFDGEAVAVKVDEGGDCRGSRAGLHKRTGWESRKALRTCVGFCCMLPRNLTNHFLHTLCPPPIFIVALLLFAEMLTRNAHDVSHPDCYPKRLSSAMVLLVRKPER